LAANHVGCQGEVLGRVVAGLSFPRDPSSAAFSTAKFLKELSGEEGCRQIDRTPAAESFLRQDIVSGFESVPAAIEDGTTCANPERSPILRAT